jgi:hydrogenase maturation protein HypF
VSAQAPPATVRRVRLRIAGTVQGVGFRPYVFRLANELELAGHVLNDTHGVLAELEGKPAALAEFLDRLAPDAPPLARIERVELAEREPTGGADFAILPSPPAGAADTPVTPDSATCEECLRELLDPADRRHRYAFINCTNCGPRFTIVRGVPYDRPLTTMAGFQMCARCQAEYEDPSDRRFHAQPNACAACGPSLSLLLADGSPAPLGALGDAVTAATAALRDGLILAVKGIGGFHLACRAEDEQAVATLRARKHREDKPFALMVADAEAARGIVQIGELEERLLCGPERPIVLAPRLAGSSIASSVAPRALELGVMLPYAPLQHLLFAELEQRTALVMTSGNVSDEPIAFRDEDALHRLSSIADLLLVHDRPIQTRTDDSVVRVIDRPEDRRTLTLRRSRGYVPAALELPEQCARAVLACGAELKSTFCLARGGRAWVSHHIGDLENYETLCSFTDGIGHFKSLFAIEPEVVAHDLHPEYLSTKYATACEAEELIGVQHHHAHLAACLAEHGETGAALGAIFDGTGYGPDGTIWGGELLIGDLGGFRRVGALLPVSMPGGARAIREPWRMACSWLAALAAREGRESPPEMPISLRDAVASRAWEQVAGIARSRVSAPATTSAGRLFDAVAALCGICPRVNYEGQAAIELEAACDPGERGRLPFTVTDDDGTITLDPRETIASVADAVASGQPTGVIASRFHATICDATVKALALAAASESCETVVLAGGVFQNRRLLEATIAGLRRTGLRVLVPERLPIGDGGISFGQAAIASRRISETGR